MDSMDIDTSPEYTAAFTEADKAYKNLTKEWNKSKDERDLAAIGKHLEHAKLKLAQMEFFLPSSTKNAPRDNLLLARDVLEIGALYSITKEKPDTKMFERYMCQLKTYYFDYGSVLKEHECAPNSSQCRKYELLTVNLLFLLTENRTAEFHTELELILTPSENAKEILGNEFISRAVEIGKSLEEGRYNTVYQTKGSEIKSSGCQFFINKLIDTTRAEIAETIEQAYNRVSQDMAIKRLHFKDGFGLLSFANKRNWTLVDNYFYFEQRPNASLGVPAMRIIPEALKYAKELERIV